MFRYGIVALLAKAGHEVETPADPLGWARRYEQATVLLTVDNDLDWAMLSRLGRAGRGVAVVAVLASITAASGAEAVRAGATSVISRSASPDSVLRVMAGLSDGDATLPQEVLRMLSTEPDEPDNGDRPPPDQIGWLRALAGGSTVATLANDVGYSERAMFRLLHGLYKRLGVRTRTEALMRAYERGWLRG
ncbi:response regulator transcription factor [Virgisporangium aurantiacum]|uniref:DNA-binding response regulator, NarL/FixJ family, contains REC and HTH domains n=1 Tax=Virgisporangium aurantiacum TaxID=175570 RepID=A0A8J4E8W3_9ACTN|nr:response regulator transcription factor [Virgisporangium aurantiacum]GIJ63162.1 hypothetical protein Vau01_106780 [Virgisporangium aurantiacum]